MRKSPAQPDGSVSLPGTSTASTPSYPVPPGHRVPAHLARRFQQICLGIASEVTEPAGLTPTEYAVIAAVDDAPDIDQSTLAASVGMDTVSAHHILHRLEAMDLVERRIDAADRRARVVRLTQRGHALRKRLHPSALAAQERILAPLAPAERPQFLDMLTRLVHAHGVYARPGNGRRRSPHFELPVRPVSAPPVAK